MDGRVPDWMCESETGWESPRLDDRVRDWMVEYEIGWESLRLDVRIHGQLESGH